MMTQDEDDRPSGRPSRLELELQEILARSDRPPTARERFASWARESRSIGERYRHLPIPARFMPLLPWAGALLLGIAAALVRSFAPWLAVLLGLGAAICFASLWFRGPRGPEERLWRGRRIDDPPKRWP